MSLALVGDRKRVVTIAVAPRAEADGYAFIGASNQESATFRDHARSRILKLAQAGGLIVPMAPTFKFEDARGGSCDAHQPPSARQDRPGQRSPRPRARLHGKP